MLGKTPVFADTGTSTASVVVCSEETTHSLTPEKVL